MIYKDNNIIKTYLGDGDVKKLYYHDNVSYHKVTKGDTPVVETKELELMTSLSTAVTMTINSSAVTCNTTADTMYTLNLDDLDDFTLTQSLKTKNTAYTTTHFSLKGFGNDDVTLNYTFCNNKMVGDYSVKGDNVIITNHFLKSVTGLTHEKLNFYIDSNKTIFSGGSSQYVLDSGYYINLFIKGDVEVRDVNNGRYLLFSSPTCNVIFLSTTPPTLDYGASQFKMSSSNSGKIYVPDSAVDAYKASGIFQYTNNIYPISEYPNDIPSYIDT